MRPHVACAPRLELLALPGIPLVKPGDDPVALVREALVRASLTLAAGDVLVVTSKILSRADGRFVELASVVPGAEADALAEKTGLDPRVIELVLRESRSVSRAAKGALVVRHRLGFVLANAGIDLSNSAPSASAGGPWALLLPEDPDGWAERIRRGLSPDGSIGVVVSDSFGRPFRLGTVGTAIGVAGLPALWDRRGDDDLFGRPLAQTITGLADEIAAAAGLVSGQAAEGRAVVLVRGLSFDPGTHSAGELLRGEEGDLYA